MRLPPGGVVTGWAALRLAGGGFFDGLGADGRSLLDVPLLLPPGRDIRRGPGFHVRRERLAADEARFLCGVPCAVSLRAAFDEARHRGDLRPAVEVLDLALAARLVDGAGLPPPRCNWPVADANGRVIGAPDLLCEELAVVAEFDGAGHRSKARHRVDVRREDLFRRAGLEYVAFVGADLDDVDLVVDRLRAAVDRARRSGVARTWRRKRDPGPWW